MAWFANQYDCPRCGYSWTDEWSCTCDDRCGLCGAPEVSPTDSVDISVIHRKGANHEEQVFFSSVKAESEPRYILFVSTRDEHFAQRMEKAAWQMIGRG